MCPFPLLLLLFGIDFHISIFLKLLAFVEHAFHGLSEHVDIMNKVDRLDSAAQFLTDSMNTQNEMVVLRSLVFVLGCVTTRILLVVFVILLHLLLFGRLRPISITQLGLCGGKVVYIRRERLLSCIWFVIKLANVLVLLLDVVFVVVFLLVAVLLLLDMIIASDQLGRTQNVTGSNFLQKAAVSIP